MLLTQQSLDQPLCDEHTEKFQCEIKYVHINVH